MLDSLSISIFVPENNIVITVKQMFFFFFLRNRVSINHISYQLNVIFLKHIFFQYTSFSFITNNKLFLGLQIS